MRHSTVLIRFLALFCFLRPNFPLSNPSPPPTEERGGLLPLQNVKSPTHLYALGVEIHQPTRAFSFFRPPGNRRFDRLFEFNFNSIVKCRTKFYAPCTIYIYIYGVRVFFFFFFFYKVIFAQDQEELDRNLTIREVEFCCSKSKGLERNVFY